jgi:hypothetical protein
MGHVNVSTRHVCLEYVCIYVCVCVYVCMYTHSHLQVYIYMQVGQSPAAVHDIPAPLIRVREQR